MCTPKEFQMALMKWVGEAIGLGDCFSQLSLVSSCREATALLHQSLGHGHYMYDNANQGKKEKKKRVVVGNLTYIYMDKRTQDGERKMMTYFVDSTIAIPQSPTV